MNKALTTIAFSATVLVGITASAQIGPGDSFPTPPVEVPDLGTLADEELGAVIELLGAVHELPSKATFEAASPNVQGILWSLATDDDVFVLHRDRALDALAYWPSDAHAALLVTLVESPDTWDGTVHRAMLLLADHYPDTAIPVLETALSDPDVQLQLSAVEGLRRSATPEAIELLESAIGASQSALVNEKIQEALLLR